MKITKTASKAAEYKRNQEIANAGCDVCPCCGETKSVMPTAQISWLKGFLRMKHMRCDYYICRKCGAEWESEPYQWA